MVRVPEARRGWIVRNEYFVYGDVPVHVYQAQDGLHVEVLDWGTGRLEPRPEYLLEIEFDRSGLVREVTPEQFEQVLLEQQDKWKASRLVHSA